MPLDFEAAARLFMGSEEELARALDLAIGDVRALRTSPASASPEILTRFSRVLIERGQGMQRVGELLQADE